MTNLTQVVELNGIKSTEIYTRLNKYIQKNFVNPDKVSLGNVENEFLSFNGSKSFGTNEFDAKTLNYLVSIDIKDEKMKITFNKLSEYIAAANLSTDWVSESGKGYFDKNGNVLKKFATNKNYKEHVVNNILNDIIEAAKSVSTSNW